MSRQAFREKAQDIGFVKVCDSLRSVMFRSKTRKKKGGAGMMR